MIDSPDANAPPPGRRQFTIGAILLLTFMVAIAAAGFSGLVRTEQDDLPTAFVLFVIAAPLALMVFVSITKSVTHFIAVRRKRRQIDSDS
jgi:magnesium-transporting ATPase (P-type)